MSKHYIGEVGTVLTLDCGVDISDATVFEIEVTKPNGTTATWTGTLSSTDSIGYTLQTGDFNQDGIYKLQAHVTSVGGEWYGETVELYVYDNFE
jgi:hypothetical protein